MWHLQVLDASSNASLADQAASEAQEYEQQGLLPSALKAVQEASMCARSSHSPQPCVMW